jgi:two-component system, cell cycle response regulator DivK
VPRILYVEDNPDNLFLLQDGIQGIEAATASPPDLIVMDLNLPGLDGWEATRRLKARPETKHIPVIALSAHTAARHRAEALAAGCVDFEEKPVSFESLLEKIRSVLGRAAPP